jgi:hypothetical protein
VLEERDAIVDVITALRAAQGGDPVATRHYRYEVLQHDDGLRRTQAAVNVAMLTARSRRLDQASCWSGPAYCLGLRTLQYLANRIVLGLQRTVSKRCHDARLGG